MKFFVFLSENEYFWETVANTEKSRIDRNKGEKREASVEIATIRTKLAKLVNEQDHRNHNRGLLSVGARNELETINKLINGSGKRQEIGI